MHVYLTGLDPLDQPLPTGAPGPSYPTLHPVTPLLCRLGNNRPQLLQMPYLGYAGGLIGFYQADLTIPDDAPEGNAPLYCTVSDASGVYSSSALLPAE